MMYGCSFAFSCVQHYLYFSVIYRVVIRLYDHLSFNCFHYYYSSHLSTFNRLTVFISSVARWNEVFQSIDKDGSGKVSIKELDEFLKSSGMDIDQKSLHNWMTQNDKNKDGELDYDEFLAYVRQTYK